MNLIFVIQVFSYSTREMAEFGWQLRRSLISMTKIDNHANIDKTNINKIDQRIMINSLTQFFSQLEIIIEVYTKGFPLLIDITIHVYIHLLYYQ